jgi:2-oxoisovalerate ferredoxin oxidoreductase alpha subunit
MAKELIKGNAAVVKGALLAGCRAYFGYPITPASEIAEGAAYYFPPVGGTFVQAESETAAIYMVYGAASAGIRVMTGSSGPGISLKQEGISYLAGSELPCVVISIMRGGPGLGNIGPEQGDYHQVVKGGGHGNYKTIVLAPNSCQEMCDLTMKAFDLADRYRNPAMVVADGFIGQMMEQVDFPEEAYVPPRHKWGVHAAEAEKNEVVFEAYQLDDAEVVAVGYGIVSRVLRSAIAGARKKGLKVGLLRPISLWPFPSKKIRELARRVRSFLVVELSNGQMVDDVRLAVSGAKPVEFYGRMGGVVPTTEELLGVIETIYNK